MALSEQIRLERRLSAQMPEGIIHRFAVFRKDSLSRSPKAQCRTMHRRIHVSIDAEVRLDHARTKQSINLTQDLEDLKLNAIPPILALDEPPPPPTLASRFDSSPPHPAAASPRHHRGNTSTSHPRCFSSRATTNPSPPLLPGPHSTTARCGAVASSGRHSRRSPRPHPARRVPSVPARSLRRMAIAACSIARICAAVRSSAHSPLLLHHHAPAGLRSVGLHIA